jgi:hypothetical protein
MFSLWFRPTANLLFSGIITSILRFVEFFRNDLFLDYTYNGSVILTWALIEPGVYFMAAALLTLRPLFRRMFEDVKFPSYMLKINSVKLGSWRRSSKSTKPRSKIIHKEEHIEMEYSNTSMLLQEPEPVRTKKTNTRHECRKFKGTLGDSPPHMKTVGSDYEDPWLTTALR